MSPARDALTARFLEELAHTLDVDKTLKKLSLTEDDARRIIKALIPAGKPSRKETHEDLFGGPKPAKPSPRGLYTINVDGASRGNPGEAGAGAVIRAHDGSVVKKLKKYLGVTTNNMAEYHALVMGLETARTLGLNYIRVLADSELMVKQLKGIYRVKSEDLRPLYEKAKKLLGSFSEASIDHVYRADNSAADSLANEAIDTHGK